MLRRAITDAFRKLDPRQMVRNPVMFVVEVGSVLATLLWVQAVLGQGEASATFIGMVAFWLWFTVLFANFAEALAEGRGKAQAEALRRTRQTTQAKRLREPRYGAAFELTPSTALRKGDAFLVEPGDVIAADGEVIEGIASVDESAVTGESALNILLAGFTIIILAVCATLLPYSLFSVQASGRGSPIALTVLIALLVCLLPTTIGGLLSAIGIAGMDRLIRRNVIALSGRTVEAAGDVDVLLLS